jgi:hypothetical protein
LAVQRSQARELGLQIGVLPLQPALSAGLQSAQLPLTHCDLPSGRPWQSLASWHSAQALVFPLPLGRQYGVDAAHAAPAPHTQVRLLHAEAATLEQPMLQALQADATEVFLHSCSQQSSSLAHSWSRVHGGPASTSPASGSAPSAGGT